MQAARRSHDPRQPAPVRADARQQIRLGERVVDYGEADRAIIAAQFNTVLAVMSSTTVTAQHC